MRNAGSMIGTPRYVLMKTTIDKHKIDNKINKLDSLNV